MHIFNLPPMHCFRFILFLIILNPLRLFGQHINTYSFSVNIDPYKGIVSGKLHIKWQAPLSTDSIPFAFQYTRDLSTQISGAMVDKKAALLKPATGEVKGFYLITTLLNRLLTFIGCRFKK